jgi:DNA-binding CsgD family transcriptional regulator
MSPPVLGRNGELATIERFVAPGGAARLLVLSGEAGIGKTTLFDQGIASATAGSDRVVLATRASLPERELAHVSLTDLLRDVDDEVIAQLPVPQRDALDSALLRRAVADAADQRTVSTALVTLLRLLGADGPVLIAIDDAQWVDPASAAALDFALRRVAGLDVATVVTIRTTEDGSVPEFLPGLRQVADVMDLPIGPVSLAVLHHLIVDRCGVALTRARLARLEADSRGNPLLAVELATALGRLERWPLPGEPLPLPADVGRLLGDRLSRLSATARDAAFLAAAIAGPTVEALRQASDIDDVELHRGLDEATDAAVLEIGPDGRIRFRHPLLASAALEILPAAARRAWHARLASTAAHVEEQARHVALSIEGPTSTGASVLEAAAVAARERGATAMAADWMERAIRATPRHDVEAWSRRITIAGGWFADAGDIGRARHLLEESVGSMPGGDRRGRAMLVLAQIVGWDEGGDAVVAHCEAALAEATDPDLRARLRLRIATESDVISLDRAIAEVDAAAAELAAAGGSSDPDLLACVDLQGATLRLAAGIRVDRQAVYRAVTLLEDAPRRAPTGGEVAESLRAHALVWQWWIDLDELERGRERQRADLARDLEHGLERPTAIEAADLAMVDLWLGDMTAAEEHARDALAFAAQTGDSAESRSIALAARAAVDAVRGDVEAATAGARAGLALVEDEWIASRHLGVLGFVALSQGDALGATALLGPLFDRLLAGGQVEAPGGRLLGDMLEAAAGAGDVGRLATLTEALEIRLRTVPRPWFALNAARGRALILAGATDGDLEAAFAAASAALGHAVTLGMPLEIGRAHLLVGRIARRRKARREAADHLERARATFDALGAVLWAETAAAELARTGRRAGPTSALTETEDAVARLAARGLTNRQVADAAFLSPKSVEGVLARAYGKLGIRSRAELGAWLRDDAVRDASSDRESPV